MQLRILEFSGPRQSEFREAWLPEGLVLGRNAERD